MFMDNYYGICGKHFKTKEEAMENLPQPVYQKKEHEMKFIKTISGKNLYFCPDENRYYLNYGIGYAAFNYKGKYLGVYSGTGYAERIYERYFVVDYVPTEYLYDDLPADHFCNSVFKEGYYYIYIGRLTYPCSPAYLGFHFEKRPKISSMHLDVTGLQKILHK